MEYSNGTAEAYRYHHHNGYDPTAAPTFVAQASTAYCGNGLLPPHPPDGFSHLSSSNTRRFHPYGEQQHQHSPASGSEPAVNGNTNSFVGNGYPVNPSGPPPHHCDQCGSVFDSAHGLSEHIQSHHYGGGYSEAYPPPPPAPPVQTKTEPHEAAEILDLDSHKVHVYQPPGGGAPIIGLATLPYHSFGGGGVGLAPTPPYTPATSIGSAGSNSSSVGWMTPTPPLPSLAVPPQTQHHPHEYRPTNSYPAYELTSPAVANGVVNGGSSNNHSTTNGAVKNGWKPSPPATGGGNHGGGSEARRPKTYNCEACNKWFTSSGHLKRHYNTTLHKNAVKASGGSNGSVHLNGNGDSSSQGRSTTPSSRSTGTPNGVVNSPAGSDETSRTMEESPLISSRPVILSPKIMVPASPNGAADYRPPPPPLIPPPQHQQQQQQQLLPQQNQGNQQQYLPPAYQQQSMDPYRSPYSSSLPGNGGNPTSSSSSLPYYCPPGGNYSPMGGGYSQQQQQQQQQQQMQHQLGYAQQPLINNNNNTLVYPPNSNAPPPSSSNIGQQLAAGPTASRGTHPQYVHLDPFINNNNVEPHIIKDDPDAYGSMIKSHESDFSGGASDDVSPDGSEDGSMDASDAEEQPKLVQPQPVPPVPMAAFTTTTQRKTKGGPKRNNLRGVITPTPSDVGATAGIFKCTLCDKAFNRVCYLTQHNNTFHKGDKPFKCHLCGKRFPNAELFDQHQQKHAGDKPYKCPLCPKQFNHKTDLRRHMCLHTGQKPFMCQVCSKGFIRKDHMVKHVQTHTRRNALHHATAAAAAATTTSS